MAGGIKERKKTWKRESNEKESKYILIHHKS